jgi:hypothetical protein
MLNIIFFNFSVNSLAAHTKKSGCIGLIPSESFQSGQNYLFSFSILSDPVKRMVPSVHLADHLLL